MNVFGTTTVSNQSTEDREELRKKWKVTVVDFGFARALAPKDADDSLTRVTVAKNPHSFDCICYIQ